MPHVAKARLIEGWRDGFGSEWPTAWDESRKLWPRPPRQCEDPPRPGAAITACAYGALYDRLEVVGWADLLEAVEAVELLEQGPCSTRCCGRHLLVHVDEAGRVHVAPLCVDPPPPDLAAELQALYPRRPADPPPAAWPTPARYNPPLEEIAALIGIPRAGPCRPRQGEQTT